MDEEPTSRASSWEWPRWVADDLPSCSELHTQIGPVIGPVRCRRALRRWILPYLGGIVSFDFSERHLPGCDSEARAGLEVAVGEEFDRLDLLATQPLETDEGGGDVEPVERRVAEDGARIVLVSSLRVDNAAANKSVDLPSRHVWQCIRICGNRLRLDRPHVFRAEHIGDGVHRLAGAEPGDPSRRFLAHHRVRYAGADDR